MKRFMQSCLAKWFKPPVAVAMMTTLLAGTVMAATPSPDEGEMLQLGFKVLVATTKVQTDWVRSLAPGKIRPVQRTGKKYFIYPDASKGRIFVGGPAEYEAYRKVHPEERPTVDDAANKASAHRQKQDAVMRAATAHDLSDPFLGASWADLGW